MNPTLESRLTEAPSKSAESSHPTSAERFFFDNNGYLVLERFLTEDHVGRLQGALFRVVARRRASQEQGMLLAHPGRTEIRGCNTRILYILADDPLFLEMLDWPPIQPYVKGLLNEKPHHHASDAIVQYGPVEFKGMGWHIDGHDKGYRNLKPSIPLLQLKIGYYLSDMAEPDQGNLCVVPGSHKALHEPDPAEIKYAGLFPGAVQLCAPAGSAILFHNALWHSGGPLTRENGKRVMLYYAYEHPWMVGSMEHWKYPKEFYNSLSSERRKFFHGFVFDPPEERWG